MRVLAARGNVRPYDPAMAPEELEPRACAHCGTAFGCGAASGSCWCATVDVPPQVLRELDQLYDGCLCPECLERRAAGGVAGPKPLTRR